MSDQRTLGELGETYALSQIIPLLPQASRALLGPGDDSALFRVPDGRVVISSDMMIEGPDFRWDWSTPEQVGMKAIASNAADIAAMGAIPVGFQVSVAAPASTTLSRLTSLARGLAEGINLVAPGAGVTGGDLSRAPVVTLSITVFGDLEHRNPVTRSGAKPGDILAVAGELGLSAKGLRALVAAGEDDSALARLVAGNPAVIHHLAPKPPIGLGVVANDAGASAMMDISDGLLLDATRMAKASGVSILLAPDYPWDEDSLTGGEDHGLLATFPPNVTLPPGFVVVGEVVASPTSPEVLLEGVDLTGFHGGWDPFYDRLAK
jgi:thiamine-monophosphate kinase